MSKGVNTGSSSAQRVKVGDYGSQIVIELTNSENQAVQDLEWVRAYPVNRPNITQFIDITDFDVVEGNVYITLPDIPRGQYNIELKDDVGRIYPAEGTIRLDMVQSTKEAVEVYYVSYKDLILDDVTPIIEDYLISNKDEFKGPAGDALTWDDLTDEQKEEFRGGDGQDGLSAYQIAIGNGFKGSEAEWLDSLKGEDGSDGEDGQDGKDFTFEDFTPEQLEDLKLKVVDTEFDGDGNTIVTLNDGSEVTLNRGEKGEQGEKGEKGERGDNLVFSDLTEEEKAELRAEIDFSVVAEKEHTHEISDVAGLEGEIMELHSDILDHTHNEFEDLHIALNDKAPIDHTHSEYALVDHTHEMNEINGLTEELDDKANKTHTHTISDVEDLEDKLTNLENNSGGVPAEHTHSIEEVNGLQDKFDGLTGATILSGETDIDRSIIEFVRNKETYSNSVRHNNRWLNRVLGDVTDLQSDLDSKAPTEHTHDIEEVNGLQDELDNKATVETVENLNGANILSGDRFYNHMSIHEFITTHQISTERIRHRNENGHPVDFIPLWETMTDDVKNLQDEIDNLKSSGVDAKETISTAINSAGGEVNSADTFDVMAQAIAGLSGGGNGENIQMVYYNGQERMLRYLTIAGLDFEPDGFVFFGTEGMGYNSQYSYLSSLRFIAGYSTVMHASKDDVSENIRYRKGDTNSNVSFSTTFTGNSVEIHFGTHSSRYSDYLMGTFIFYKRDALDVNSRGPFSYRDSSKPGTAEILDLTHETNINND